MPSPRASRCRATVLADASVVELADTQGLGPCARERVWVRVPPGARGHGRRLRPRSRRRVRIDGSTLVVRPDARAGYSPSAPFFQPAAMTITDGHLDVVGEAGDHHRFWLGDGPGGAARLAIVYNFSIDTGAPEAAFSARSWLLVVDSTNTALVATDLDVWDETEVHTWWCRVHSGFSTAMSSTRRGPGSTCRARSVTGPSSCWRRDGRCVGRGAARMRFCHLAATAIRPAVGGGTAGSTHDDLIKEPYALPYGHEQERSPRATRRRARRATRPPRASTEHQQVRAAQTRCSRSDRGSGPDRRRPDPPAGVPARAAGSRARRLRAPSRI